MKSNRPTRIVSVLILLAAALAAVAVAKESPPWSITPVPRKDAWWQQRQAEKNARIKQGHVDLLFIGDSITHSWENGGKQVWDKYYAKRNAVNLGFGGDRVEHVLWRLEHGNLDGIAPKLAVLMIGTNNAASPPGKIAQGIELDVAKIREKLPRTKILVLAIFPRGKNGQDRLRQSTQKTNELISKAWAGDDMVTYLDIGRKFLEPDGTLSKDIMPDYLHPNAKGYEIWAEAIEPTVKKLMGEK